MSTVTISVTAEHIAAGEREKCEKCPVALAFLTALPRADRAVVTGFGVSLYRAGVKTRLRLPDAASDFISAFDNSDPVAPFSFDIEIPEGLAA
jgi:hypothetical protein